MISTERELEGGREHAQIIAPFEGLNRGQRGVETTDVDYTRVMFHQIKKRDSDQGVFGRFGCRTSPASNFVWISCGRMSYGSGILCK